MYLLPKPKTIKEQDGQMLLCHSTHIVMTKRWQRQRCMQQKTAGGDQAGNGAYPAVSVGEVREGDLSLGIAKHYQSRHMRSRSTKKADRFQAATGLACFMVWRPSARSYSSVAGYCPVYRFRMPRICQTVVIILTRQGDVC